MTMCITLICWFNNIFDINKKNAAKKKKTNVVGDILDTKKKHNEGFIYKF